MTYNGLVHAILDAAPSVAALVAKAMVACERSLLNGQFSGDGALDPTLFPRDALLESLPKKDSRGIRRLIDKLSVEIGLLADSERLKSVLSRVILRAWIDEVGPPPSGRRPDVLRLTAEILSNPDFPASLPISHFAIILALRIEHGIYYTKSDIKHLQDVHSELRGRFAQKARRMRRSADNYEAFVVDLLCFKNRIWRTLTQENLSAYYDGFRHNPLGIGRERRRELSDDQDLPQLRGDLPDFPSLLTMIFGQPSCIPGIDDVIGGLVPAVPDNNEHNGLGGHITLIVGPPGSGKTSLCLTLASRIAELGGMVRYVSTEEDVAGLDLKQVSIARDSALARSLFPDVSEKLFANPDFQIRPGYDFVDIVDLAKQLEMDLSNEETSSDDIFLPFMRVVVIDSLSILLSIHDPISKANDVNSASGGHWVDNSKGQSHLRRRIGSILRDLRDLGIAVFLVVNDGDETTRDLEYLADNVFHLGTDDTRSSQHPLRTLAIEKTRFQVSHRGKHVVHLSRHEGFSVSPSLHSVIRSLSDERISSASSSHKILIYSQGAQMSLPFAGPRDLLAIRSLSRVLVYGRGTAGKSRFALKLALEPRLPESFFLSRDIVTYEEKLKGSVGEKWLERCRILVVSFLFGSSYYEKTVKKLLSHMFGAESTASNVQKHLTVLDFYPGFIDAETVVMRIRRELDRAVLSGRRYTAVVIDGVHNALLQFPFLEKESLLWPALYRVFSFHKVDVITTFTFFSTSSDSAQNLESWGAGPGGPQLSNGVDSTQKIFWHLLVSGSDYTFIVERAGSEIAQRPDAVRVTLATSIDKMDGVARQFLWDPRKFDADE